MAPASQHTTAPSPAPHLLSADTARQRQVRICSIIRVVGGIALSALGVFLLFHVALGLGRVEGNSMYPSLKDGDIFIYIRPMNSVEVGDVVVFRDAQHKASVKRVVAVAGSVVDISDGGELMVDGAVSAIETFYKTYADPATIRFPFKVAPTEVVLMGDKRDSSRDSRHIGAVSLKDIEGKVLAFIRVDLSA